MNTNSFITREGILLDGNSITQKEPPYICAEKEKPFMPLFEKAHQSILCLV
jgi:hypothetical protein